MQTKNQKYLFIIGVLVIGALAFSQLSKSGPADTGTSNSEKGASLAPFDSQELQNEDQISSTVNDTNSSEKQESMITENAVDTQKMQLLNELLTAKNDNDPRLDTDFKNLSPSFKKLLMIQYTKYKPEQRNEKGTVAFIVSRELKNVDDLDSLKVVFEEPPCKSLGNCSVEDLDVDPHHSGLTNVDLNYPQMVTLYQIDQKLNQGLFKSPNEKSEIKKFLNVALNHPVNMVRNKASEIIKKHSL